MADPYFLAPADGIAEPTPDELAPPPVLHGSKRGAAWLDFDYLWGRFSPVSGATMNANIVRFGPRVAIGRFFYVGGEVDIGALSGDISAQNTVIARDAATSATTDTGAATATSSFGGGTYAAAKALAGVRLFVGPFSGSVEFAAGVRDYTMHDSIDRSIGGTFGSAYEAHARIDLWITPKLTVGALASTDVIDRDEMSVGVVLGVHFRHYDGMRH